MKIGIYLDFCQRGVIPTASMFRTRPDCIYGSNPTTAITIVTFSMVQLQT